MEREYQDVAKLRLSSLFADGTEGAHRVAVLLGIAATCRSLGVPLAAYLTWLSERRVTHWRKYGLAAANLTLMAYTQPLPPPAAPKTPDVEDRDRSGIGEPRAVTVNWLLEAADGTPRTSPPPAASPAVPCTPARARPTARS